MSSHTWTVEEWRAIPGYEGRYEASSLGRIRSLISGQPRVLKPTLGQHGYLAIGLRRDNASKTKMVHRLILEAFQGPCPDGFEAAHDNGDRSDNRSENLSWKTPKENHQDRIRHGRVFGENAGSSKLTTATVIEIRESFSNGVQQKDLAAKFGVCQSTISKITRRENWPHL